MEFIQKLRLFIFRRKKLSITIGLLVVVGIFLWNILGPKQTALSYQTAQVTKGTLVVSLSESGSVASANRQSVTTAASGVVSEVDVKNGDRVTAGQTIAKITLDSTSQQKQAAAWASYLSAENSLANAQANVNTLQATLFKTNQAFVNDRGVSNPSVDQQADPVYIQENDAWLAAEAAYKNQQNVIAENESSVTSAWLSYQQASGVITAPVAGVVSDITVVPGMQIAAPTLTTTVSSQTIASIKTEGNPIVSVTISELDATKITSGQKATVTFDALPNQTFTGKVAGINTAGTISGGVTTYPATIVLDTPNDLILPNMSATANIITNIRPNVLLVPSGAVISGANGPTVKVLQNNLPIDVPVTIGASSDTETEITSGLKEGQTVIVGTTTGGSSTTSPFSGGFRIGGGRNRVFGG